MMNELGIWVPKYVQCLIAYLSQIFDNFNAKNMYLQYKCSEGIPHFSVKGGFMSVTE
jgi:hypothetical protein